MLLKNDKIAIVACSNAQPLCNKEKINELEEVIKDIGLIPVFSDFIYEKYSVFSGRAKERGKALMKCYLDKDIKAIFDISGGDVANEVLEYLDFQVIKNNPKPFFGYSDLTTVINAIYSKTENLSYLYQIRNLVYSYKEIQKQRFINSILLGKDDLFNIDYEFLQGNKMSGVVIGGNIRCFLKLSGTPYMPDLKNKILLLESCGGEVALMTTYLTQLKQMRAFEKINGIILGTFTKMEQNKVKPNIEEIVLSIVDNKSLPIIKTNEIGHGMDSKCMIIGKNMIFEQK
ncbi:MAG: S66 peptidase family protein [Clostridium sp.]